MPAKKNQKGSGFAGKVTGKTHPKGSTLKKNPDGTVSIVPPKKKSK